MKILLFTSMVSFGLNQVQSIVEKKKEKDRILPIGIENASAVIERLFDGYRDEIGPIRNGKPVQVRLNLLINDMMPMKQADMHFSLDFYLRMKWLDPRLAFKAEDDHAFIPFDNKFSKKIWTPNLYFPNGKAGHVHSLTKPNIFVEIHQDGNVAFSERISLLSYCQMNMTYYPFDIQRCDLAIEDYSNPIEYLRLAWMKTPTETPNYLNSKDFAQIKVNVSNTTRVGDFGHKFDRLIVKFALYRDIKIYVLRDFLPCILIVIMSWISFWVDYKVIPARVTLGITTILTTVSMMNSVQKANPPSNTLRSLDLFLLVCLVFVFGALIEFAITGMVDRHGAKWWRKKLKEEEKEEENGDVNKNILETSIEGTKSEISKTKENLETTLPLLKPNTPKTSSNAQTIPLNDGCFSEKYHFKYLGPFAIPHSERHIVDQYAKILFPVAYFGFVIIFFLFHYLHPDTVGGKNE